MCCGNDYQVSAEVTKSAAVAPRLYKSASPIVVFEYKGRAPMTVAGSHTGRLYRFSGPGARAIVDSRDAARLRAMPRLKAIQR